LAKFRQEKKRKKKNHSGPVQREEIHIHKTYVLFGKKKRRMDLLPKDGFDGFAASEEWIWRICFRRSLRVFGACDQSRILDFF
jgi:hypothetical protein